MMRNVWGYLLVLGLLLGPGYLEADNLARVYLEGASYPGYLSDNQGNCHERALQASYQEVLRRGSHMVFNRKE